MKIKDIKPGVVYGHRRGVAGPVTEQQYEEDDWQRRKAAILRAGDLMTALRSHGVTAVEPDQYTEPTTLVIPLDDVETLLGLLGGERP